MANATTKVNMMKVSYFDTKTKRNLATTAATYYNGEMIALDASGNAVKSFDTAGLVFCGINDDSVPITVPSGASAGDYDMDIDRPYRFSATIASAAAGDEGKQVFALDSQTVGYTSSGSVPVGWVDRILDSTHVLIRPTWAGIPGTNAGNWDGLTLTFTGTTGNNVVAVVDNLADAYSIKEGSNSYFTITTTNGSELTVVKGVASTGATNAGGGVQVTGGIGGATSGAGGTVAVTGGAGTAGNAAGGAVSFIGGLGQGSAAGGAVTITSGAAGATGVAGAVNIAVGGATAGAGSAVTITGGNGAGGTAAGGNVNLVGGTAVSTGVPGEVQVNANSNLIYTLVPLTATDASRPVFICTRPMRLKSVSFQHTVGSTSGTLQVEKLTGTTAAGSGTVLLTGTIDLSATTVANTTTNGTLIATVASLTFATGDRISIKIAGTMTNLVNGIVAIGLVPV